MLLLVLGWQLAAADWLRDAKVMGTTLERGKQWTAAAGVYQSALTRVGADGSPQDRFWLLSSLAEVSFELRDYTAARGWLHKADDALRGLPLDAPERVRLLNAWGTLHLVEGNLTAAERELSRAVEMSESIATPPDLAATLHNLAAVEMHIGHLRDATAHETKALTIWRQEFGDRHHYVMKALIGLSSIQGLCGEWRASEDSLRKALDIAETPEALANYAVVLEKLKRGKEAREIRRRLHLPIAAPSALVDVKAMALESTETRVRTR